MKTIYLLMVVAAFAALSIKVTTHTNSASSTASDRATDGAFRDGMYLGSLAAERGETPHVAFGRWATAADRQSFTEGYEDSYREAAAKLNRLQRNANIDAAFRHRVYAAELGAESHISRPHIGLELGAGRRLQPGTLWLSKSL